MKILAVSDLHEDFAFLDRLPELTKIEAVVFTGNVLRAEARRIEWERAHAEHRAPSMTRAEVARERDDDAQSVSRFLKTLNVMGVPVFLVPGKNDAPERFFLQAAFNTEIVAPNIYTVHRSFAPLGSNYVVAGFGGEITEDERDNEFFLRYPGWEAEFTLEFLRHLKQEKILLFHTAPAEKFEGSEATGHKMVSHIIKTYDPQFAVCARQDGQRGKMMLANTLVVCPGQLRLGNYAVLDTKERSVAFGNLR
ncbi:MAG: metallophosphoesterase [bacterium]